VDSGRDVGRNGNGIPIYISFITNKLVVCCVRDAEGFYVRGDSGINASRPPAPAEATGRPHG